MQTKEKMFLGYINPKRFKLVSRIEIYEFITEVPVILVMAGVIMARGLL